MKKTLIFTALLFTLGLMQMQAQAEIKFLQTTANLGEFYETDGIQSCEFRFVNTGDENLFVHQAFATCGCTVPSFPEEAIAPGDTASITATYNPRGRMAGTFKKKITIHSNAKTETVQLVLTGVMLPPKEKEEEK